MTVVSLFDKNRRRRDKHKGIRNKLPYSIKLREAYSRSSINLSNIWTVALLDLSDTGIVLYLYGTTYFFKASINNNKTYVNYDINSRCLLVLTLFGNNFHKIYWTFFREAINSFNVPFFRKIKFKGKGYYIFKNLRQTITPQFGHSHRRYAYSQYASVIFLSKVSIITFSLTNKSVVGVGNSIKYMRPISIYTGRGVRFSREVIYRKVGKVSSYR
jgi:ribosomal protein L6P/L9E